MVKVTWLGLACFLLEGKEAKVLLDPYEAGAFPQFWLDLKEFEEKLKDVDFVISTHEHADHNYFEIAPKARPIKAIYKIGATEELGKHLKVKSHSVDHGFGRGKCAGVLVYMEGKKVYHFGDTCKPSRTDLETLSREQIDLALVPVGGYYTMGPREAVEAIKALNPKKVIPMHYRIDGKVAFVPNYLDDFLREAKGKLSSEIHGLAIGESIEI